MDIGKPIRKFIAVPPDEEVGGVEPAVKPVPRRKAAPTPAPRRRAPAREKEPA